MRRKIVIGISFGCLAGIIDVIPMVLQKLTWDANLSAFSIGIAIGYFLSTIDLKINPVFQGILVSFLCLLPAGILIAWKEPVSLIPISIMTIILGTLLGWAVDNFF